jgi:AAA domain
MTADGIRDATMSGADFLTKYSESGGDRLIAADCAKPNGAVPADRLRLVPPSEVDWRGAQLNLVKGILGFGMMALLYGASGSAKTLIALSLALHIALGRGWCGRTVKQGFVAYLAPEGGHSVHLRFHAWCRHHGLDPSDDSLPFRTVPVRVDLCKSVADLEEIITNIKAAEAALGPCVLIVVDTVSRALDGGDENAPADMGNFVANCDRMREATGATVLGVHHTPAVGDNPRGHTCLKNGSEIRMLAKKVANGLFSLKLEHLKDGAAGDELLFKLQSAVVGTNEDDEEVAGGLVVETAVRPAGGSGQPDKLNERQLRILQELRKEAAATGKSDFTTKQFNELCVRSGAVDIEKPDSSQRRLRSDLKMQLANKGLITIDGDTIRLVALG